MLETTFYSLQFSALIFFNLLCILGIIGFVLFIFTMHGISKKVSEVSDKLQNSLDNIGQVSVSAVDVFSSVAEFLRPRKKTGLDIFRDFIKRK